MLLTNPLFLIGLVAVGIPIAIHLLQLRRYRKVYFSNVEMLQELKEENHRQNRLRQLLILAARILAIVFLVLAFCQPVIPNKEAQIKSGGTVVSVYIDNSYSMECGGMEGSLIESAKQKAREIAAAYKPSDHFQLLTNEASGAQFRWLSREEFVEAVDAVQTSPVTAMMSVVSRRQNEFLHNASATNKHAYIVSDFQRSTADMTAYTADTTVLTTFIPLGGSDVADLYIDSLAFDSPAYCRGASVTAQVTVRNGGDKAVERLPLRLFVNGKQRALTSVDVAPHSAVTAPMVFTIEEEGVLQGYVETTDYPVTFDDKMFFTLNVAPRVPMLVVGGAGENPFLQRLFAGDSLVEYAHCGVNNIDYAHLTEYRFIVLDELSSVPSGLAQTLQQFVSDGGTVLVVPGEKAERESYNRFLASVQAPHLGEWRKGKMRVSDFQVTAKLYQGVFQGKKEDIEMPTVEGMFRLQSVGSTVQEVLATMPDGSTFLACSSVGEGSVYLFASPLRKEYTDFVHQALFVPTLYNMALFSTGRQTPYHLLSGSDPIALQGTYEGDEAVHLISEDGQVDMIPEIRRIGSRQYLQPHDEMTSVGNYRIGNEGLSFNYSRQESVLEFYAPKELKKVLSDMGLRSANVAENAQKSMTDYVRQRSQGTPLWRWCLVLVLLMLAAETVLIRMKK